MLNRVKWVNLIGRIFKFQVKVDREGATAQVGMTAVSDIEKGETLFEIPRSLLLTQENCSIASLLKDGNS